MTTAARGEGVSEKTIRCGSKDVPHNTIPWRVCTNRHTSTAGNSWGWIEGAPGNICWSNDNASFNRHKAGEVVAAHNQWLEEQKPIHLRIIEASEKVQRAQAEYDEAEKSAASRLEQLADAKLILATLEAKL